MTSITPVSVMVAAGRHGVGPHVEESGLGLIAGHAYSAPYEDIRIKK